MKKTLKLEMSNRTYEVMDIEYKHHKDVMMEIERFIVWCLELPNQEKKQKHID